MLTQPRPTTAALLAAAGISVQRSGRIWTVLMDGKPVCWMATEQEAEQMAYELAMAMMAEGLV